MTLPLFQSFGFIDKHDVMWCLGSLEEANPLLSRHHYLGAIRAGGARLVVMGYTGGEAVACQVWRTPTSRRLPTDGTVLELSRWCLTPAAGEYAGSRQHRYAVKLIRDLHPEVVTLVSYSDPSQGHTGSLYRAANWQWFPTWMRLRQPPSAGGAWSNGVKQAVKDRWAFILHPRRRHAWAWLLLDDPSAVKFWRANGQDFERKWAANHPQLRESPT